MITENVTYYIAIGFKEDNKWFESFNRIIEEMDKDKTLLFLKARYVMDATEENPEMVKFDFFPNVETVKIAITSDLPPIDYVASDGTPAGFNTAMLAEIARRLKINVELININSGARAAALASWRADGVFWFWYDKTISKKGSQSTADSSINNHNHNIDGIILRDVPAGVKLTVPYYSWDQLIFVGRKHHF